MPVTAKVYTARLPGGGAAVMDTRTGRGLWRHLNPTAASLWHQLAEGTPLNEAADDLTTRFVNQGADRDTVRADLAALTRQLRDLDLLTARSVPPPRTAVLRIRPVLPVDAPLALADRAAATLAMAAALVLLRCTPIRISIAVARAVARIPASPATTERADHLFAAVRRTHSLWPGRAACLEESLACYLAARLRGHRITWVIGARTSPAAAHAWNEAGGEVIGQRTGDRIWPYAPALRI
ncbi:lasso peptide biosynthesis B2 protein [Streptomyces sp. NPDC058989]|uniref:lasso peptide biosynthesis B2 protein n=1 Tax=Streptomyces sp. NPDC058989 TaxID=3346686 RepID=UPI0036885BE4